MSDIQDDFHATVEDIREDAKEIEKIEDEKAQLDPADPRASKLSERAETLAEELHHKTIIQRDLSDIAGEAS